MALELNGTTGVSLVQDGVVTAADLASGAITSAALPTDSVLQVVNATYSTGTSSSSNVFIDTGLAATITPTSATSKILIFANMSGCEKSTNNTYHLFQLFRDSTSILSFESQLNYTGNSSRTTASSGTNYLDSPSTTSAVTYKVQFASGSNNAVVIVQASGGHSTITLMEIAG